MHGALPWRSLGGVHIIEPSVPATIADPEHNGDVVFPNAARDSDGAPAADALFLIPAAQDLISSALVLPDPPQVPAGANGCV